MIKVLFVCLGNICRSPMAEGVFQHMVEEAGLADKISSDSAGLGDWHAGESAHRGTRKVLQENGIDYAGRARQIRQSDLETFDYVLMMDASNMDGVQRMANGSTKGEIAMFLQYAVDAGTVDVGEVPDPYYNGRFDYVYDLVERGSKALLKHIRQQHGI